MSQSWDAFENGPLPPYPQLFRSIREVTDFLPFNKNKPYKDPLLLHQKYVVQGLSTLQIAREFFCSKNTIRTALIAAGIKFRMRQEKGRSSNPRYGRKPMKGYPVDHLVEQRVIKTIIEMRDDGLSFSKIAKFLGGVGVPTKMRRKKWRPEVIRQICLKNTAQIP